MAQDLGKTRLLIADDHPIVLDGIEALFRDADFAIVASCRNGEEVLSALPEAIPDMLILDIQMPKLTGLSVLRKLRSAADPIPVILLTASLSNLEALEAIQLGVNGLILKETAPRELLQIAQLVRSGERWLDPEATKRALSQAMAERQMDYHAQGALTRRETDLTRLVSRGLRNKEIAAQLEISEGTVKMHLHRIYEKLGVSSRTELVIFARDHDIGQRIPPRANA